MNIDVNGPYNQFVIIDGKAIRKIRETTRLELTDEDLYAAQSLIESWMEGVDKLTKWLKVAKLQTFSRKGILIRSEKLREEVRNEVYPPVVFPGPVNKDIK